MKSPRIAHLPLPSLLLPLLGLLLLGIEQGSGPGLTVLNGLVLMGAVLSAVYHAEVLAHRLGEPLGSLVLALAVTAIELALIVSMTLAGGATASGLARDTVFATVMIVCNGVLGLCLLVGGLRHRIVSFSAEGASGALSVIVAMVALTLVLPQFTETTPGPMYSNSQLAFASLMSLLLYLLFLFVQTVRHREYFLPASQGVSAPGAAEAHRPPALTALISLIGLMAALVGVVGLAKKLSPAIKGAVAAAGLPPSVVGLVIALLVLLPETLAALGAARRNQIQISLNLALGSVLATIGLTIPAVGAVAIALGFPLELGLSAKEIVLLTLTLGISAITVVGGQATILQGAVHLVLFAVFLFFSVVP
ncbi:MAG: calcium:proton antiporter [Zoogloea sp.]|uniref:calcium:proton antiporter n=1 Tax=Zoogloea sp. TaxID=49181 RepID=UPI003F30093A